MKIVAVEVLSICCRHGGTGETHDHIPSVATFSRDEKNKVSIFLLIENGDRGTRYTHVVHGYWMYIIHVRPSLAESVKLAEFLYWPSRTNWPSWTEILAELDSVGRVVQPP